MSASGGLRTLDPLLIPHFPPVTKSWRRHWVSQSVPGAGRTSRRRAGKVVDGARWTTASRCRSGRRLVARPTPRGQSATSALRRRPPSTRRPTSHTLTVFCVLWCGHAFIRPIAKKLFNAPLSVAGEYWPPPPIEYEFRSSRLTLTLTLTSIWTTPAWNGIWTARCESTVAKTHTRLTALCPGLPGRAGTRKVGYKKLSYRRVTARCFLSVVILPITTHQCRNYLYDKSWPNRWYEVGS